VKWRRQLAEGEELEVQWERFADGLPHRLRRNRDYPDFNLKTIRQSAMDAAGGMNKVVRVLSDRTGLGKKRSYVWVQFADYELLVGQPCKCGGRQILRFHQFFGRCAACNAQILFTWPDKGTDDSIDEDKYGWGDEGKFGWA
jgi:hypothetical protein